MKPFSLNMKKSLFVLLALCLGASHAWAQDPSFDGATEQVSVVEEQINQEVEESLLLKKDRRLPEDAPEEIIEIIKQDNELRFPVKQIKVIGNTILSEKEIREIVTPYEGQDQTVSQLEKAAKKITERYRRKGFITSTAYVPEQALQDGLIKLQVVEGKLGNLSIEGSRYFSIKKMKAYVPTQSGEPLKYATIKEAVRLLNKNPDREVRSILRKGKSPETTDIILKVKDSLPLHAGTLFDNQGGRTTGRYRFGLTAQHTNLAKLDDRFLIGTIFGKNFGSLFTRYQLPISPKTGTELHFGFSHSQVDPQKELKPFGVNGLSQTYSIELHQDYFQNRKYSLTGKVGFYIKESRTRVNSGTFRRESLNIIRFGHTFGMNDRWGRTRLSPEFSFGTNLFGAGVHANPGSSRQGVETAFIKMKLNFSRAQKMPFGTSLNGRGIVQIPTEKLANSEGLYLGGGSSVRGYPEGDYIGDGGVRYSFDYLIPFFLAPQKFKLPYSRSTLRKDLNFVLFLDHAYGRLRGPSISELKSRNMLGIGVGLRMRLYKNLYGRVEWARAYGDHPITTENRQRFHFRVQAEI